MDKVYEKDGYRLRLARKARRLERAFSCQIPGEVYDRMEQEMGKDET